MDVRTSSLLEESSVCFTYLAAGQSERLSKKSRQTCILGDLPSSNTVTNKTNTAKTVVPTSEEGQFEQRVNPPLLRDSKPWEHTPATQHRHTVRRKRPQPLWILEGERTAKHALVAQPTLSSVARTRFHAPWAILGFEFRAHTPYPLAVHGNGRARVG